MQNDKKQQFSSFKYYIKVWIMHCIFHNTHTTLIFQYKSKTKNISDLTYSFIHIKKRKKLFFIKFAGESMPI